MGEADKEKMERLENDIKRQRNVICSNDIAAKKKQLTIVQSKDGIICQDCEIKTLQLVLTIVSNNIAEKDVEIVRQHDLLTVKDAEIDAHRATIAEKDVEIVGQRDL